MVHAQSPPRPDRAQLQAQQLQWQPDVIIQFAGTLHHAEPRG